ncbi:FUSC family membrane protein [Streptomyces zhihengii]
MRWLRVLGAILRAGLTIERTRLEPLVALRAAAGVAIVVGLFLWLVSPAYAASSALGAFSAGTATFQRSWRPRKVLALGAGAGLAISTFCGYVAAGHPVSFLLVLATWTFLAGMAWSAGPTAGIVSCATVAAMLVTVTLPTSVTEALEHAGVIAFGGLVQAALIWAFPIRRWGAHRDALADAFAALADFARRLRHDPEAPFDAEPMTTARDAATLTPSQARRRPAVLHGSRGLAERIRPVLATLADPEVGAPAEGRAATAPGTCWPPPPGSWTPPPAPSAAGSRSTCRSTPSRRCGATPGARTPPRATGRPGFRLRRVRLVRRVRR